MCRDAIRCEVLVMNVYIMSVRIALFFQVRFLYGVSVLIAALSAHSSVSQAVTLKGF